MELSHRRWTLVEMDLVVVRAHREIPVPVLQTYLQVLGLYLMRPFELVAGLATSALSQSRRQQEGAAPEWGRQVPEYPLVGRCACHTCHRPSILHLYACSYFGSQAPLKSE